jgi:CHASE2 domain-containing sensor protein
VPDNGQAIAGFVFSLVGVGLLVISFGLSTIVSLGCAITGVICSRNGKRKVDAGETPKHRGLAQAGFIIGWVGVGLSILATAGWILAIVLGATDSSSGSDFEEIRHAVAPVVGG